MKKFWKAFLAVTVLIILVFVGQAIRIGLLFVDFDKAEKSSKVNDAPLAKLPPDELMIGLTLPDEVKNMDGEKVPVLFERQKTPLLSSAEIKSQLEGWPESAKKHLLEDLLKRVVGSIKNLSEPCKLPEIININAPLPDYRGSKNTADYWYFAGRQFAIEGHYNAALSCFAGIAILAHKLEAGSSENSATLLSRMIAISLRRIASVGIFEMAPELNLPAKLIRQWASIFLHVENRIPDFSRCLALEKLNIPSVCDPKNMDVNAGYIKVLRDKDLQHKYIDAYFDPLIEACKKDFHTAYRVAQEKSDELNKLQDKLFFSHQNIFSLTTLEFFFSPEDYIMMKTFAESTGSYHMAVHYDFLARQQLRAAAILLVIQAYKAEFKKMPESIEKLEDWFGKKLPLDLYSQKPFIYKPSGNKILYSVGEDCEADNADDLVFMSIH